MKKLYVGNLPFQANEEELRNWFQGAGATVANVALVTDKFTGQPRGFASSSLLISTKANPRGCPVNLSVTRLTLAPVAPACVNQLLMSSCVAWNGKLPTYSFFKVAPLRVGTLATVAWLLRTQLGEQLFPTQIRNALFTLGKGGDPGDCHPDLFKER